MKIEILICHTLKCFFGNEIQPKKVCVCNVFVIKYHHRFTFNFVVFGLENKNKHETEYLKIFIGSSDH